MHTFAKRLVASLLVVGLLVTGLPTPAQAAASFNPSRLIDDSVFLNIDKLDLIEIQHFLELKGSFLANYSENGRTAAQIIVDAAHAGGEAAGNCNNTTVCSGIDINRRTGTVSPEVILVTLQKEQGLITMTTQNDAALRTAMGYGCPDSGGCNPAFAGFTKQVEHASWQLRFNYERAAGKGFPDYQVGQAFCTADFNGSHCGTYDNRATAALYRYTPHVFNGNSNFQNFLTTWFEQRAFAGTLVGKSPDPQLAPGGTAQFVALVRNNGTETWHQGLPFPVRLGTVNPRDTITPFIREDRLEGKPSGWSAPYRVMLEQESVAPNEVGAFRFYLTAPADMAPGSYGISLAPVAENFKWFEDFAVSWKITVLSPEQRFSAAWGGQNDGPRLVPGMSYKFSVALKNTGVSTWTKDIVRLGTARDFDRLSQFSREDIEHGNPTGWASPNRIYMQEDQVPSGGIAHFDFYMSVPSGTKPGTYREYFRPVADGTRWMQDLGIYWDIVVL